MSRVKHNEMSQTYFELATFAFLPYLSRRHRYKNDTLSHCVIGVLTVRNLPGTIYICSLALKFARNGLRVLPAPYAPAISLYDTMSVTKSGRSLRRETDSTGCTSTARRGWRLRSCFLQVYQTLPSPRLNSDRRSGRLLDRYNSHAFHTGLDLGYGQSLDAC